MKPSLKKWLFVVSTGLFGFTSPLWAGATVYIPNGTANEILVVDASTHKVTGSISGVVNVHGLVATPDGAMLIAGSLTEMKPGAAAIPPKPKDMTEEEHRSHHAAPAPDKAKVPAGKAFVSLITVPANKVIRQVEVTGGIHHMSVTPDGRYAIATHPSTGGISVIDIHGHKVFKTIQTGPLPNYSVVTGDGKRIYVSNAGNNTISEVDTQNWIVSRNMLAGATPEHMVLSPDEKLMYVNNVSAGTVSVVELNSGKIVRTYKVGKSPHGIDFSDDGKTLFVSSKKGNKLFAINLADGSSRTLALTPAPYHVTTIAGSGKLYVSSRKKPIVWVVDQNSLKLDGEIAIRGEGHEMAVVNR